MGEEIHWSLREPDFTQPLWLNIEKKLGRPLTPEENKYIYYRSGMFKEWLFEEVDKASTPQEIENLLTRGKNFVAGKPIPLWKLVIDWFLDR
jgi:hypothetical protein